MYFVLIYSKKLINWNTIYICKVFFYIYVPLTKENKKRQGDLLISFFKKARK